LSCQLSAKAAKTLLLQNGDENDENEMANWAKIRRLSECGTDGGHRHAWRHGFVCVSPVFSAMFRSLAAATRQRDFFANCQGTRHENPIYDAILEQKFYPVK
jgi:hypothetical protein